MSRSLAANVWVDGTLHAVGSTPPKDVADQITNPSAWGETEDAPAKGDDADEKLAPVKKSTAARKSSSK